MGIYERRDYGIGTNSVTIPPKVTNSKNSTLQTHHNTAEISVDFSETR